MADDELIEIELGFDRLEAQLIAAQCEGADIQVELRLMDNSGQAPGLSALQAHRLLLRADDRPEVEAIVEDARGSSA